MEDHEPEARMCGWMTLTKILVPTCRYCLNCTKFGQLILRKIIKIVATRCLILRLKCTKFDFGRGSAPDLAEGAYSAPPDPLAGFKGPTCKGRKGGKGGEGSGGIGRGGKGRRGGAPFNVLPPGTTDLVAPLVLNADFFSLLFRNISRFSFMLS